MTTPIFARLRLCNVDEKANCKSSGIDLAVFEPHFTYNQAWKMLRNLYGTCNNTGLENKRGQSPPFLEYCSPPPPGSYAYDIHVNSSHMHIQVSSSVLELVVWCVCVCVCAYMYVYVYM
jgi:hypothetical protein